MDDHILIINELKMQIESLPKGNITHKMMHGRLHMYLQWMENGKQKNKYIRLKDEQEISELVARRKVLEEKLQRMYVENDPMRNDQKFSDTAGKIQTEYRYPDAVSADRKGFVYESPAYYGSTPSYHTNVLTGSALKAICDKVSGFGKRECMSLLRGYLERDMAGRVCLIFGLRRTGKTTMVLQAISELPKEQTAYIKIMTSDTMKNLNQDLKKLSESGCRYVFIDEVTLLADFIDGASLFSDVYAMFGMKIVMSGTDSLGFAIAEREELYDRTVTIHTTFIPFREYAGLLGIRNIDDYIRYGGTFQMGETSFDDPEFQNESVSFRDDESTRRYIDTAIARNIQHSLACYQEGGHFRHLVDLYEAGELTGAINRIIEDMNHRFLVSVLTRDFKSHDLGSAAQIERKHASNSGSRLIQTIEITQAHITEIREYLKLLELIMNIPAEGIDIQPPVENIIFIQPGMRYCQAQALVHVLMKDEIFRKYPAGRRKQISDRILEEVRGRMLEEIVLLETVKTLPKHKRAFKLMFDVGEFDMVIADTEQVTCEIYEIKHSDQVFPNQYRHLIDEEKCHQTEYEYGEILSKTVLYRGEDREEKGIHYRNVEEYLTQLHS